MCIRRKHKAAKTPEKIPKGAAGKQQLSLSPPALELGRRSPNSDASFSSMDASTTSNDARVTIEQKVFSSSNTQATSSPARDLQNLADIAMAIPVVPRPLGTAKSDPAAVPTSSIPVAQPASSVPVALPAGSVPFALPASSVSVALPASSVPVAVTLPASSVPVALPASSLSVALPVGSVGNGSPGLTARATVIPDAIIMPAGLQRGQLEVYIPMAIPVAGGPSIMQESPAFTAKASNTNGSSGALSQTVPVALATVSLAERPSPSNPAAGEPAERNEGYEGEPQPGGEGRQHSDSLSSTKSGEGETGELAIQQAYQRPAPEAAPTSANMSKQEEEPLLRSIGALLSQTANMSKQEEEALLRSIGTLLNQTTGVTAQQQSRK
eukprot:g63664.t1